MLTKPYTATDERSRAEVLEAEEVIRRLAAELAVTSAKVKAVEDARRALTDAGRELKEVRDALDAARADYGRDVEELKGEVSRAGERVATEALRELGRITPALGGLRTDVASATQQSRHSLEAAGISIGERAAARLEDGVAALRDARDSLAGTGELLLDFARTRDRAAQAATGAVVDRATADLARATEGLDAVRLQLDKQIAPASRQIADVTPRIENLVNELQGLAGRIESAAAAVQRDDGTAAKQLQQTEARLRRFVEERSGGVSKRMQVVVAVTVVNTLVALGVLALQLLHGGAAVR